MIQLTKEFSVANSFSSNINDVNNVIVDLFLEKDVDKNVIVPDESSFYMFADSGPKFLEELSISTIKGIVGHYSTNFNKEELLSLLWEKDPTWFPCNGYLDYEKTFDNIEKDYDIVIHKVHNTVNVVKK